MTGVEASLELLRDTLKNERFDVRLRVVVCIIVLMSGPGRPGIQPGSCHGSNACRAGRSALNMSCLNMTYLTLSSWNGQKSSRSSLLTVNRRIRDCQCLAPHTRARHLCSHFLRNFCIAAAGFRPRGELSDTIFLPSYETLTLHVLGRTDVIVVEERSKTLLDVSSNKRVEWHDGGELPVRL